MLPRKQRIPRSLFLKLKTAKQIYSNKFLLVKLVPYAGVGSRFSVSVSKKRSKSAVVRNKLRRLGYNLITQHANKIKKPILLQVSWLAIPKDKEEALVALENLLDKMKII